jgi:hypothetical protein
MENNSENNFDEKRKLEYLKERKSQNLQILQKRIHELNIEKQKRERTQNNSNSNITR